MRLAITGASGYIGERLVAGALKQGHTVLALSRRAPAATAVNWQPFDLADDTPIELPSDTNAVIHLAAATQTGALAPEAELSAARRLLMAAGQCGAHLVFVSSQTAREDAPTSYGRVKWRIEQEVLAAGGIVVRPGQVYGGDERGLFGVLVAAVRRLPAIPAFVPAPRVQPVHVDDLVAALLTATGRRDLMSTVLCIGAAVPTSFTAFLRTIARHRLRCHRLLLPVPVVALRAAAQLAGPELGARLGLTRLGSLFDLPLMATESDLARLGIALRPLSAGMTRTGNGRRRALIREAWTFLAYILRARPTSTLIRRYVRAIEQLRTSEALLLPEFLLHAPFAVALFEEAASNSAAKAQEMIWRLNAAVILAEASPQGAERTLGGATGEGFVLALLALSKAVACEAACRAARIALAPLLRGARRNAGFLS